MSREQAIENRLPDYSLLDYKRPQLHKVCLRRLNKVLIP